MKILIGRTPARLPFSDGVSLQNPHQSWVVMPDFLDGDGKVVASDRFGGGRSEKWRVYFRWVDDADD